MIDNRWNLRIKRPPLGLGGSGGHSGAAGGGKKGLMPDPMEVELSELRRRLEKLEERVGILEIWHNKR